MNTMIGVSKSGTLIDGVPIIIPMINFVFPATVWVAPAVNDSVTVSYSVDNGNTYKIWPNGVATEFSNDTLISGVTHLKFQRTAGSGITSTYGIC